MGTSIADKRTANRTLAQVESENEGVIMGHGQRSDDEQDTITSLELSITSSKDTW